MRWSSPFFRTDHAGTTSMNHAIATDRRNPWGRRRWQRDPLRRRTSGRLTITRLSRRWRRPFVRLVPIGDRRFQRPAGNPHRALSACVHFPAQRAPHRRCARTTGAPFAFSSWMHVVDVAVQLRPSVARAPDLPAKILQHFPDVHLHEANASRSPVIFSGRIRLARTTDSVSRVASGRQESPPELGLSGSGWRTPPKCRASTNRCP